MKWLKQQLADMLVRYLTNPSRKYESFSIADPDTLRAILRPADVLLVEGNQRFSVAVKYLTQSTWSHTAIYIGNALGRPENVADPNVFIEADLENGVIAVPLSKYRNFNTRICRPVGLSDEDRSKIVEFAVKRLGTAYDLKNVIDLARYLLPTPPVPVRWRRRLLALGSGDPTRAICSTLIAQAFQAVNYPILPNVRTENRDRGIREIMHVRHHSLFTPRDFDVSPYFRVVKPTLEHGFKYKKLVWEEPLASRQEQTAA